LGSCGPALLKNDTNSCDAQGLIALSLKDGQKAPSDEKSTTPGGTWRSVWTNSNVPLGSL
jgi:hypothetical protein